MRAPRPPSPARPLVTLSQLRSQDAYLLQFRLARFRGRGSPHDRGERAQPRDPDAIPFRRRADAGDAPDPWLDEPTRVGDRLSGWYLPRFMAAGVYERMAKHRTDYLLGGVWDSLSVAAPSTCATTAWRSAMRPRNRAGSATRRSSRCCRGSSRASRRSGSRRVRWTRKRSSPGSTISPRRPPRRGRTRSATIRSIPSRTRRCVTTSRSGSSPTGCCCAPSASVRPARSSTMRPRSAKSTRDVFDVRSFSVRNLPTRWAPWDMAKLIGDLFADKLRMPCPVATNLCLDFPDAEGRQRPREPQVHAHHQPCRQQVGAAAAAAEGSVGRVEVREGRAAPGPEAGAGVLLGHLVQSQGQGRYQRAYPEIGIPRGGLGPAR
jgi:hypothetical protein